MQNGIRRVLKKFRRTSGLLSFIRRRKYNCITKEQFDEMYKTNQESEERIDLSAGDDLETLIGSIKSGVIEKELFSGGEDYKHTFLLCLLDEKERQKLKSKDEDFMHTFLFQNPDVPDAKWKLSKSKLKYARSYCSRQTYFIHA